MGAVQDDEVARVIFQIQIQAHSNTKKTQHHWQLSQLYTTCPIQLELSPIREHQLNLKGYNQTVELYHKNAQATLNTMKRTPGQWQKFPSQSQLSDYCCTGSITDDKSTLVTPTLLDPSETSGSLGETSPKQRQHNLNKFQVYSVRDNSGHEERKETMSSTAGRTPNSSG